MTSNSYCSRGLLLWLLAAACAGEETAGPRSPTGSAGADASMAGASGFTAGTSSAGTGLSGIGGNAGTPASGVGGTQAEAGATAGIAGVTGGTAGTDDGGGVGGTAGGVGGTAGGVGGMAGASGGASGAGDMGGSGGSTAGTGGASGTSGAGDLCMRWRDANANLSVGAWNGSVASCDAGTLSAEALASAHGLHSLYREMAGLEPVSMTDEGNRLAQECALLMAANGRITHTPPDTWNCYTTTRAATARTSSLSTGNAIDSVKGYMIDPGNATTLGHRRWILSHMLVSVGYGSAGMFSCQYQPATRPAAGAKAWVAWPPDGPVPLQSLTSRWANTDQTGWSVQSDTIDLSSASATVTSDGTSLPVTVTALMRGYGSTHAIRINPTGWATAAGKTYNVKLSGTATPIEYNVEVIDCP